ncbi:hypothetical protein D3C72_616920 [compost metagenome]
MMRFLLSVLFLIIFIFNAVGQTLDSTATDSVPAKIPRQLVPFPVIGNAPETGFQYGFGVIYTFYLHPDVKTTRSSYLYSFNMWTVKKQTQLILQGSVWTKNNMWNLTGVGSYTNYPIYFYGLGNDTKEADKDLITSTRYRFMMLAKHKIIDKLYAGMGLWYQNDTFVDDDSTGIYTTGDYYGKDAGNSLLIGYGGAYDTRDVENSSTKGTFIQLVGWTSLGVSGYKFSMINLDARQFYSIDKTKVAGAQFLYQTTRGSTAPFYYLPYIGGDTNMRGYYVGRYRDENMMVLQGEFRYRPWGKRKDQGWFSLSRLSFAGFLGTGLVFESGDFNFGDFKPNYGGGFRYMFEPTSRMTLRFDYGVGSKNAGEKRSAGFYISLNEAF